MLENVRERPVRLAASRQHGAERSRMTRVGEHTRLESAEGGYSSYGQLDLWMRDQSRASEDYARNAGATGVSGDEQAYIVCDDPHDRRSEVRRVRRLAFAFRECGISGELPETRRDHGADPFGIFEDVRDHEID